MTACKACGIPIEGVLDVTAPQGIRWVHLTDRSPWCHTTQATPDGTLPSDAELAELLNLGWSLTAIAARYRCNRTRLSRLIRARGIRPTTEGNPAA